MGWFASLFSSDTSQNSRRGQAMSSTHEAFSLPTSSPGFSSHPDAFNPELLNTPEPDSATSPSFTYPPQSGSYGYVPTSAGLRSRPTSILPLHHTPTSPSAPYPPLSQTWNRLRSWLTREYPELGDTLNYGILPQDLALIEMQFGFALPTVIRESYLVVDGQEAESAAGCSEGLFFGLTLLPLEDVLEEWRFWREVDEDPATGANTSLRDVMQSIPPGWVRKEYSQRGWIPLIADKAGNYVGVDLNPAEGGSVGQVIVFGRDFDTKVVLWRGNGPTGWATWLASFVEELETGEGYELGSGNDTSEGSEDGVGYESYFYDGSGRGQGDGGGESGSGGLRLAGEYRGWSVLEAWADRSLRRWHEAGLLPEAPLSSADEKQTKKERHGLGVLDFAAAAGNSGAEVPIPVLADVPGSSDMTIPTPAPDPAPALGNVTNTALRQSLPTISVTKPPAPLPVELPTPRDIVALPSPPDSTHSSDDDGDLEAGHGTGMREVIHEQEPVFSASRTSTTSSSEAADAIDPPATNLVPVTPGPAQTEHSTEPLPPSMSDITDLLTDSAPAMEATPITPSSPSSSKSPEPNSIATPKPEEVALPQAEEATVEEAESSPDPDVTIRLVGGGGTAGTAEVASTPDGDVPPADVLPDGDALEVTSPVSVDSVNSTVKKGAKHEKNKKSISSGLKKLGQLGGGKRKKDSSSSLKDAI